MSSSHGVKRSSSFLKNLCDVCVVCVTALRECLDVKQFEQCHTLKPDARHYELLRYIYRPICMFSLDGILKKNNKLNEFSLCHVISCDQTEVTHTCKYRIISLV